MIATVLEKLAKIEDPTAHKLLSILNGKEAEVKDSFYSKTVFESQEKYQSLTGWLNGQVIGSVHKKMVETPLVFIRAKQQPVFTSSKNQGIAFGFTMVDYRSSTPLVIVTVDIVSGKYEYKSTKLDNESNKYVESEFSSVDCSDLKALVDMVLENLNNDVDKWINKY
jgi:hypothetical protein